MIVAVDDVDAEVARLGGLGIAADPRDAGQFRIAMLPDPCGNTVTLSQAREAQSS